MCLGSAVVHSRPRAVWFEALSCFVWWVLPTLAAPTQLEHNGNTGATCSDDTLPLLTEWLLHISGLNDRLVSPALERTWGQRQQGWGTSLSLFPLAEVPDRSSLSLPWSPNQLGSGETVCLERKSNAVGSVQKHSFPSLPASPKHIQGVFGTSLHEDVNVDDPES